MRIIAKFSGKCSQCGGVVACGDPIEWEKGRGSRHVSCGATPAPQRPQRAAKPAPRLKRAPVKQPEGTTYLTRRSQDRHDDYERGDVLHCPRVPGGGGPDGRWWAVVAVLSKYKDDDTDEWMCQCYARPATDAECAPLLARRQATTDKKALVEELQALARTGAAEGDVPRPDGRELVLHPGAHGSGLVVAVLRAFDGEDAVSVWCSGYYDDYVRTCSTTRDPRALEVMRELLGEVVRQALTGPEVAA